LHSVIGARFGAAALQGAHLSEFERLAHLAGKSSGYAGQFIRKVFGRAVSFIKAVARVQGANLSLASTLNTLIV
jgi:hypothetical protein